MKRFLTIMAMALMAMVMFTSCSSDEPKDNNKYNFIGSYIGYDESDGKTYDLSSLTIRDNNTFTHTNVDTHLGYQEEWQGEWTYDKETNIITLHYLIEKISYNGTIINEYPLEDDYCWAQPYDNGNKLRYKEYWDDAWEDYTGFLKTSYTY